MFVVSLSIPLTPSWVMHLDHAVDVYFWKNFPYHLCFVCHYWVCTVLFGSWERNTGSNQDPRQFIWTESTEMISNHVRSTLINVVWGQIDVHFDSTGRSCVPTEWQARVNCRMMCALPSSCDDERQLHHQQKDETFLSKSFLPWNTEVAGNEWRQNRVYTQ